MATITEITISSDTFEFNPRKDYDNSSKMACWHDRYVLGDEQPKLDPEEFLAELPKGAIVKPLYLLDHSGLSISTSGFSCSWDSGQVGIIYVTPEEITNCFGDDSEKSRELALKMLESDVKQYDCYLRGDVWGFDIKQYEPCPCCGAKGEPTETDSCFGFFNVDDSALADMKMNVDESLHGKMDAAWEARFE